MPIYHTPFPASLTKTPGFAVRITDLNVYNSLAPLFMNAPLGFPVIVGMSPVEMAAYVNCRITSNIRDGHPTIYDNWMDVPCVIVTSYDLAVGFPPPLNVGSGDLPNGQQWAWQCGVEYYGSGVLPPNVPTFVIKTGVYTGNGTSQSIATGMDMTAAHASIMVKPLSGGASARGAWRVTGMTGSSPVGTNTQDTTAITALTSTGFTVGNNLRANANGVKFGYVAMIDTAGTYMRVGTYTGLGNTTINITGVLGQTTLACAGADARWAGAIADFVTQQYTVATVVPGVSVTFGSPWAGASGPVSGTVLGDNRIIPVGFAPTHVWVMGGSQIYRSEADMAANQSVSLGANGTASPMTNGIKGPGVVAGVGTPGFTIGINGDVNSNNLLYAYVAFKQATALLAFFTSGKKNPAGGSDTITGLPFQPGWVTTIDAAAAANGVWRAINVHTGTDSTNWAGTPDGVLDVPAQGISSLDAAGFHTGTAGMPAGHEVYWFAFVGSGSISPAPTGPYVGVCPTVRGTVNQPFWAQLSASGGTAPYTYVLILDSLPPGLVLDENTGIISGTPTLAGVYPYTVRIMDATMDPTLASSVTCAITVVSVGPTPQPPAPTPTTPSGCTPSGFTPAAISSTSGCRVRSDWP